MKLEKKHLDLCKGYDKRSCLMYTKGLFVDTKEGRVVYTTSSLLLFIPFEKGENDGESFFIDGEDVPHIAKLFSRYLTQIVLERKEGGRITASGMGEYTFTPVDLMYPNYKPFLGPSGEIELRTTIKMLSDIVKKYPDDHIVLNFSGEANAPVGISGVSTNGVFMPTQK